MFFAVSFLFLLDLFVYAIGIYYILPIFERRHTQKAKEREKISGAEPFRVVTKDGVELAGAIFSPKRKKPKGLILYFPEYDGNYWSANFYCRGLIDCGYKVISFDFRNQGESEKLAGYQPLHWLTEYEMTDAEAVMDWIETRDDLSTLPFGVFGTSRGGSAGLEFCRRHPKVKAVVADGAFTFYSLITYYTTKWAKLYVPEWLPKLIPIWRLQYTLFVIRKISEFRKQCQYVNIDGNFKHARFCDVLLIAGQRDGHVPLDVTNKIKDNLNASKIELWVTPDAKHNESRDLHPVAYDRRVVGFFDKVLAP